MRDPITVRDLIAELIKHDMNIEVCLSIDEIHQTEHGISQGYSFNIDSIEYEYGALMIKFKDYRSDKKQVCEEGDKLVEWIKSENRITELEKTVTNIQSVVLDLMKEREKILDEAIDGPGKDGNIKEGERDDGLVSV